MRAPTSRRPIRLAAPGIGEAEIEAAAAVLRSGRLAQGARVAEFEKSFARRVGAGHAICVSSGTAALHLALLAAGVAEGDEVIVPDFAFPAVGNVVKLCGAVPVPVDIDLPSFTIDTSIIEARVTRRTRAIVPVHLFGNPAEMDPIRALVRRRRLALVEHVICGPGARYRGKPCGVLGDLGCFSFNPRATLTTGEGGMVVTDDAASVERLRRLRNHGIADGKTCIEHPGYNYRLTEFQAALGLAQLKRLDELLAKRARLAALYGRLLRGDKRLSLMAVAAHAKPAWQSYVVLLHSPADRAAVIVRLEREGIEAGIGSYALSAQPAFGAGRASSNARVAAERSLALPLHPEMADADVERVAAALRAALASR